MRFLLCFPTFLLLAIPALAQEPVPEETLYAFYNWVLTHPAAGVPTGSQFVELSKLLTPQLANQLSETARMETRCERAAQPGDKPEVLEGDIFVGNYEGATDVAYRKTVLKGGVATAEVGLVYMDPQFPKAHKFRALVWHDRVELRKISGQWRISDIKFERGGTLVSGLRGYLKDGAIACKAP